MCKCPCDDYGFTTEDLVLAGIIAVTVVMIVFLCFAAPLFVLSILFFALVFGTFVTLIDMYNEGF